MEVEIEEKFRKTLGICSEERNLGLVKGLNKM